MAEKPILVAGKSGQLARCLRDLAVLRNVPMVAVGRPVSTDYVFDGAKPSPYREDDATAPLNIYGSSKLAGEAAVLGVNPRAAVIRTAWVYSPYGTNFVRTMLRLSKTQPMVRVVYDQHGTPTSAADLARAILAIVNQLRLASGRENAGIYHLGGQGETSWYEFAAAIFASLSRRGQRVAKLQAIITDDYPTAARRPKNSCLDSSKAERVFGVRLPPWRSSLEECLDQLEEVPKELHAC